MLFQQMMVDLLLEAWDARSDQITQRREALLQMCAQSDARDGEEQDSLVRALAGVQEAFLINYAVSNISLYGAILRAEQVGPVGGGRLVRFAIGGDDWDRLGLNRLMYRPMRSRTTSCACWRACMRQFLINKFS